MATIEKRTSKNGVVSYRVTVADGVDSTGKQIRRRKTFLPDQNMTPRQQKKALSRFVAEFELEVEQGFQTANNWKFADYAAYVIDLKERAGCKHRTIESYRKLLDRINTALGHKKLTDIHPQHLNAFYKNLSESGIRQSGGHAVAKIDFPSWLKKHHLSRIELASRSGLSVNTVALACQGKSVRIATAQAIADALELKIDTAFTVSQDTRPLSAKTIREYHAFISTVFAQAEKEMLINFNPAAKATPPRLQEHSPDYFQPEQIGAILDALEDEPTKWKAMTYLLIDSGCRRGEAAGAKWDNIDFATGVWTIDRSILYSKGRGVYESTTKTSNVRTVKLNQETLTMLRHHRAEQSELRLASGDAWADTGYVFTQLDGHPIHPDSISGFLNRFSARHKLPHIHPHAFRHTAASTLIASGIDLVTTANELGHANATTTAAIYAHVIDAAKTKAADARSTLFKSRKSKKQA